MVRLSILVFLILQDIGRNSGKKSELTRDSRAADADLAKLGVRAGEASLRRRGKSKAQRGKRKRSSIQSESVVRRMSKVKGVLPKSVFAKSRLNSGLPITLPENKNALQVIL